MRRHPVDSSAVASLGYDPHTQTLEIEFVEGRVYQYRGVPPREYEALLQAKSIGTYVNQIVKPKYPDFEEID